jgi:hypothetical protein
MQGGAIHFSMLGFVRFLIPHLRCGTLGFIGFCDVQKPRGNLRVSLHYKKGLAVFAYVVRKLCFSVI